MPRYFMQNTALAFYEREMTSTIAQVDEQSEGGARETQSTELRQGGNI